MASVVGQLPRGKEWSTEVAGSAILGGAALLSLIWRCFLHSQFGKHIHPDRKPFLAYWVWGSITLAVMHLFLLFQMFYFDRDGAGYYVNWTRWIFYAVAYGICGNGLIAEFQLHPNSWTRYYSGGSLIASFLFNMLNAFCNDHQARLMLGGLSGVSIVIYVIQLFYFDGRFRDRAYSFLVSLTVVACIGVGIAMFVAGHANKGLISRADEFIGFLVIDCVFFSLIAMLMKNRWMSVKLYHEGVDCPDKRAECGFFSMCCAIAVVDQGATAPLSGASF